MACDLAAITQVCVPLISHYVEDVATRYPQGENFISASLLPAKHENVTPKIKKARRREQKYKKNLAAITDGDKRYEKKP